MFIPDPGLPNFFLSRIRIKEQIRIPDRDPDFLPIPDHGPGVKKAPDPGSGSAILAAALAAVEPGGR
jgi:hypothetical protein